MGVSRFASPTLIGGFVPGKGSSLLKFPIKLLCSSIVNVPKRRLDFCWFVQVGAVLFD